MIKPRKILCDEDEDYEIIDKFLTGCAVVSAVAAAVTAVVTAYSAIQAARQGADDDTEDEDIGCIRIAIGNDTEE